MQVAGQLGKLGASALLLPLLLILRDIPIVIVQVAAHLVVLLFHVLQVLLSCVEIVFPSAAVVAAIAAKRMKDKNLCFFKKSTGEEGGTYNF